MNMNAPDLNTFLENLAYQLVFNKFIVENERVLPPRPEEGGDEEEVEECGVDKLVELERALLVSKRSARNRDASHLSLAGKI